jgi:glycosyltransferase involved in cell wall biosynthesis
MRILSVVTLVSPLNEYGGPIRVAVNQAHALAALGHEVLIVAAARGFDGPLPQEVDGVPARLFPVRRIVPGRSFSGLGSPGLWRWLRAHGREFDVAHVHAARDFVTMPAARILGRLGTPYVLQTHGMVTPDYRPHVRLFDAVVTRTVLTASRSVLHLTDLERDELTAVGAIPALMQLPNGVPEHEAAPPAVRPQVLYLARLAPRKRPELFVEVARRVGRPDVTWTMVGPDEGQGRLVTERIAAARAAGIDITWTGAMPADQTLAAMQAATLYVLPSIDEPFPMSVLEAMSVGLPVVITETNGLADAVTESGGGAVVDHSLEHLTDAVADLLADPARAAAQGAAGRAYVRERLSMSAVARRLEELYAAVGSSA